MTYLQLHPCNNQASLLLSLFANRPLHSKNEIKNRNQCYSSLNTATGQSYKSPETTDVTAVFCKPYQIGRFQREFHHSWWKIVKQSVTKLIKIARNHLFIKVDSLWTICFSLMETERKRNLSAKYNKIPIQQHSRIKQYLPSSRYAAALLL